MRRSSIDVIAMIGMMGIESVVAAAWCNSGGGGGVVVATTFRNISGFAFRNILYTCTQLQ